MKTFTQFLNESRLDEALISFGGKSSRFGQVLIMAGGAGSGKGFVLNNLVGIEGKVLDVDALKEAALKSDLIKKKVKDQFGTDLDKLSLKNPDDVSTLHALISDMLQLTNKRDKALFASIYTAHKDRKPNLIFDVTLKDLKKLQEISFITRQLGYEREDIHIIWVVNDIEIAKEQNEKRSRTVPVEILVNTHQGVSMTMKNILDMGDSLNRYMNGSIHMVFNKANVDSSMLKSDSGGKAIKEALYVVVKQRGKPQLSSSQLDANILKKIREYVPNIASW